MSIVFPEALECFRKLSVEYSNFGFHLHDCYEIYIFLSGEVNYFVESSVYHLKQGDILIFNSQEIHCATFLSDTPYERVVVKFDPQLLEQFMTTEYCPLSCFKRPYRNNGEGNLMKPETYQLKRILAIAENLIIAASSHSTDSGALQLAILLELTIAIDRLYHNSELIAQPSLLSAKLQPILSYINNNITSSLSLDEIQSKFFMNKHYICRLFKNETGNTIHNYIIHKRITLAKQLLLEGHSVTEASSLSGFNDYSNFIKCFKKIVGMSPLKFVKKSLA